MTDGLRKEHRAPQDKAGGDPESRNALPCSVGKDEQLAELNLRFENFSDAIGAYEKALAEAKAGGAVPIKIVYLYRRLAECHIGRGEMSKALVFLDEARSRLTQDSSGDKNSIRIEKAIVDARTAKAFYNLGKYQESQRWGVGAYEVLRSTSLNTEIGRTELTLGGAWFRLGEMERAKDYCRRALASFERERSEEDLANAYNNLGLICKSACQWKEATKYLEKARLLAEKLGHTYGVASRCLNLGVVKIKLSEWELAGHYLDQALRRFSEIGNQSGVAKARIALGQLHLKRREWDVSGKQLKEGLAIAEKNSFGREVVLAREFLGELSLELGRFDEAEELLNAALKESESLGDPADLEGEVTRRLADVSLAKGDAQAALRHAQRSMRACARGGDSYEELAARRTRGRALVSLGRTKEGFLEIQSVLSTLRELGERYQLARTCLCLASSLSQSPAAGNGGDSTPMIAGLLREASETFAALGLRGVQAEVQLEIARAEHAGGGTDRALDSIDRGLAFLEGLDEPVLSTLLVAERRKMEKVFAPDSELSSGELRTFLEVDRLTKAGSSAEKVLTAVLRRVVSRTGSDSAFISTCVDGKNGTVAAEVGMRRAEANRVLSTLCPKSGGPVTEGAPLVVTNVARDSRLRDGKRTFAGISSLVFMPFSLPWETGSAIFVSRKDNNPLGSFSQADLNKLVVLMNFAAMALFEIERGHLLKENVKLKGELESRFVPDGIITRNREMIEILQLIEKIGDTNATVLLEGETGTGKGLLARAVHRASRRRSQPVFQINCAALPEPLLESELFGHVQGAFTGAISDKKGLFAEANGGTVFLDEVDKTSASVQSKLLHVLDRQEVRPVGANKWQKVDVRVICATNVDLKKKMADGTFLDDLFYRMNDIDIVVPPLRDRRDDIPVLAAHFVQLYSEELEKDVGGISPEAMDCLLAHDWRGNVRELEKTIKRMIMLSEEGQNLEVHLLAREMRPNQSAGSRAEAGKSRRLRDEVARTERRAISEALEACGWNKSEVARQLGVSYPCLLKKIRDFDIDRRKRASSGDSAC
jgi:transcriptional regulator with GAF, ATPase, and Fis domain/tetratricopeptide (TPR) repeat protein